MSQSAFLSRRRLLVVEDDWFVAAALVQSLEAEGAEVLGPAPSVARALRALEEAEPAPDGAVLDINLGGERVYPVAEALRARGVPFVFVTGYDPGAVPEAHAAAPVLSKPVTMAAVAKALFENGGG